MADEKIVTSIVATSDFSNLIADVQRVTSSLHKLQQEFAGANRALAGQIDATNAMFKETLLKTGQFSSHFVSLSSDVEKFGRNLDGGRLKLNDYFRVYREHVRTSGGLIRDLAKQQVQLQNAVLQPLGKNAQGLMQYNVHIPRGLDLTKNKTALLKQELQIMNKVIQDGGVQLINWGKNTQWAGRQLTVGLTLPLVAFGKAAADAFKVADQELTRLTKVYGDVAGTSAAELSKIRKEVATTAKELSSTMGVNFAETISLAADIAATGKTGNELLSSISETTRLAVLGEVDRQEAMKATLAIQSAFKANTEELAESINFLNAVENQTSTTLNDLVEAIPKAGPVIKGLGGSIEDLALYLTAMREGGINASEGANALKSALASLINPTDVAVKKFQGFGIDLLGIVNKNAGDVTGTLFALQSALDRLDPLSKQQAIEQLFGKFQFSRLNALFENLGRQGSQTLQVLDLMKASAGELEAVAGRELTAVTESAAGRYRRAVESLKADMAGVGDQFLNVATKLITVLNKILEFGQKLPDPIKKIVAFGGAFTAIIGPVIMLTGVLANFFGYIIKGLGHFKALFKGAEGFKLLTPEIIAAKNAGSLLNDEFYSDAKAAETLRFAIQKLNEDLVGLQLNASRATTATSGLGQVLSTAAGTPIMPMGGGLGGPRIVVPGHSYLGGESRAAAHLNPRNPNDPSTIFGLTLQPIPLNRRIGRTPQILMGERLPDIEGVTTVGGLSTGVVASEHARYAALMATLGVQSQQEIEQLKKIIGLGGSVSKELIDTFDDILPITQRLTANAATQSAAIVADLRAGKITADQALAAIFAANAELERMMGIEITAYAASRGRTIDLTKSPLIDQPVVDAAGKPNTRGMFRQGTFRDVMDAVGRATRTRTYGGPYSIETTRPRDFNRGGKVPGYTNGEFVYMTNGETVPGPNVNADVVPAMLTPGEFVLTRDVVAQQGSDNVQALHEGRAIIVPFGANIGGTVPNVQYLNRAGSVRQMIPVASLLSMFPGRFKPGLNKPEYEVKGTAGVFGGSFVNNQVAERFNKILKSRGQKPLKSNMITREKINALMRGEGVPPDILLLSMMSGGGTRRTSTDEFLNAMVANRLMGVDDAKILSDRIFESYARRIGNMDLVNDINNPIWDVSDLALVGQSPQVREAWRLFSSNPGMLAGPSRGSLSFLENITLSNGQVINFDRLQGSRTETFYHAAKPDPLQSLLRDGGYNRGGKVPGYNGGGGVSRASLLARLGAKFKYEGRTSEGFDSLQTYRIKAMDPNGGRKYFGHIPGLSNNARGALYNATLEFFNSSIIKGDRVDGKRMFMPRSFLTAMPTIAANALTWNRGIMTPEDILILEGIKGKGVSLGGSVGSSMNLSKVYQDVFRANRGGPVPYGYARGVQKRLLGGGILKMLAYMGLPFAGQALGNRVGGGAGSAISAASWMLPMFAMPGMMSGRMGLPKPTIQQRLGKELTLQDAISMGLPIVPDNMASLDDVLAGAPMAKLQAPQLPQLPKRKQSIFAQGNMLGKYSGSIEKAATSNSKFAQTLGKVALGLTKTNVIIGTVATAVAVGYGQWKKYQEGLERTRLSAGLTEQSAGKLGLKFKDFGSELKASLETYKAWMATNRAVYEGMMQSNAPFKMTITEYKKLRKEVKGTMQDQIDLVNNTEDSDLPQLAVQLKAMFVAAGMSADEAAKKVYMVFTLSKKASQAYTATLGNKGFNNIKDSASAASAAVDNFNIIMKKTGDGKAQVNALNTAWMALTNAIKDAVNQAEKNAAKNKTNFNAELAFLEEENELLDKIAANRELTTIGEKAYKELILANPQLAEFVSQYDTVVSLMQKQRLLDFGFAGDLLSYNPDQISALYDQALAINKKVIEQNKGGALKQQYADLEKNIKKQKELEAAARGEKVQQQINRRDRIKGLEEEIKKINEAADARKKALQEEAEDQDINIEIQKKRLEYQQKLAAGDMGGAAQAQLDLQQLVSRQQRTLTERQIEERRLADIAPLQAEIDKLNDAAQKIADNAALAGDSLQDLIKKIADQKTAIDNFNNAVTAYLLNQANGTGDLNDFGAAVRKAGEDAKVAFGWVTANVPPSNVPPGGTVAPHDAAMRPPANPPNPVTVRGPNAQGQPGAPISPSGTGGLGGPGKQGQYPRIPSLIMSQLRAGSPLYITPAQAWTDPTTYAEAEKAGIIDPKTGMPKLNAKFVAADNYVYQISNLYGDGKNDHPNGMPVEVDKNSRLIQPHVSRRLKFANGGHIRGFFDGTTDGPVSGPGTWTSDSILARLSDGEFVTKSSSVHDAGVDNMHLINQKGAAGILEAAMNIAAKHSGGGLPQFHHGGRATSAPLVTRMLIGAFNKLFPNRKTASDGILASEDHYKRSPNSDHTDGFAADITHDPSGGVNGNSLFYALRKDPRVKYLIWNRKIWNPSMGDGPTSPGRNYFGDNPHNKHIHISLVPSASSNLAPWLGAPHELGMSAGASASKRTSENEEDKSSKAYTVRPGDSLSQIAAKYGTTVAKLLAANPNIAKGSKYLGGSRIFSGTKVNIPGFKDGGPVGKNDRKSIWYKIYDNLLFPTALWADRLHAGLSGTNPISTTEQKRWAAWDKQMKEKGVMSVLPSIFGQQALDFGALLLGGPAGSAVGRSLVEGYGVSKGIPALGTLLPKGSIPYLGAQASNATKNIAAAAVIGTAKPFIEGKASSMINSYRPTHQQVSPIVQSPEEIAYQLNQIVNSEQASRTAIMNQINLAEKIAEEKGRFALKLIGPSLGFKENPRFLFKENLDPYADDILNWPWSPAIKTKADKYSNQAPMWWDSLHSIANVEKLTFKQKKAIAQLAGVPYQFGKGFPKITKDQLDSGYEWFYDNPDLVAKWKDWNTYKEAVLKSVGLREPVDKLEKLLPADEAQKLADSLQNVRLKNSDGTDGVFSKYSVGSPEADPRWSTAFGSNSSVIRGGQGDRGYLMLDSDLGEAVRRQFALVYEDLIKTGAIRRAIYNKKGKRVEQKDLAPRPYSKTGDPLLGTAMTFDEFLLRVSSTLPDVATSSRKTSNEMIFRPTPFVQALNESYVKTVLKMDPNQKFRFYKYDIWGSPLFDEFGNPKAGGYYTFDKGFDYSKNYGSSVGRDPLGGPGYKNFKATKGGFVIDLFPREFPSPVFAGGGFTDEFAILVPEWLAKEKSRHVLKHDPAHFDHTIAGINKGRGLHAARVYHPTEGWKVSDEAAAQNLTFGIHIEDVEALVPLLNSGKIKTKFKSDTEWNADSLWNMVQGYSKNAIIKEGNSRRISEDWLTRVSSSDYSAIEKLLQVQELVNLVRKYITNEPTISMFKERLLAPKFAGGGYINPSFTPKMNIPSFDDGVNNVYTDMLAQVHKNEAIVPAEFNPWNPTASNPLGGEVTINNNLTINASPDMNTDELTNKVFAKVEAATSLALAKAGRNRTI